MSCLERLCGPPRRLLHGRVQGQARGPAAPGRAACANVLTPDRVPEFCIPPRLARGRALAALGDARGGAGGGRTDAGAGRTDWDPRSQAALSLPHLPRARTAYGFCALLESPHTRRKESLLLGRAPAPGGLLSRALARARPVSPGDEGEERGAGPAPPPPPRSPRPGRPQAGATVTPGRAEHRRPGGRLRIRLRGAEGPPARGRSVLQPPGPRGCAAASERGQGQGQGELPMRGALRCSGGA